MEICYHKRDELPTLINRHLQDVCILMYKVKHKLCPINIWYIFNNHTFCYILRQSDFSIPRYNTVTYGKHSLCYLGPKPGGKLSTSDRSAKTLNAFKKQLCPINIWYIFNNHTFCYILRQSDFSIPRYNTVTYGKHSLCYLGPKPGGKLSTSDRSAKTLNAFKKQDSQMRHNFADG